METLVAPTINLAILIGFLAYYLKAPLKAFVTGRHETLRDEVSSVRNQLQKARKEFEEYSGKLKGIEAELKSIRTQAQQDAAASKTKLLNEAKKLSAQIADDAEKSAENLYADLKASLRSELSEKVIERATAILKSCLTGDDKVRIQKEFSKQVEMSQ